MTTINAVAAEAGVVPKTIHLTFRTKAALMHGVIQVAVAGDTKDLAVAERPAWTEMLELPPRRLLEQLTAMLVDVHERTADLFAVAYVAAASDPELAQARAIGADARARDFRRVAAALGAKQALRPGLSITQATGTIVVLASDATYRSLVRDQGWSATAYRSWLRSTLTAALLNPTSDYR